jgi:predicted urease superfamily metal-dependent hydrolase
MSNTDFEYDLDRRVFSHHINNVPVKEGKSFENWFDKYIGLDYKCESDGKVKNYYFYGMNGAEFEILMDKGEKIWI